MWRPQVSSPRLFNASWEASRYIPVYTSVHQYIPLYTSIYQYTLVYKWYIPVFTSIYTVLSHHILFYPVKYHAMVYCDLRLRSVAMLWHMTVQPQNSQTIEYNASVHHMFIGVYTCVLAVSLESRSSRTRTVVYDGIWRDNPRYTVVYHNVP